MEELLNCVMEICCGPEGAQRALVEMFKRDKCHTPEDCARMVFEYFTLAPREEAAVKAIYAKLARENPQG